MNYRIPPFHWWRTVFFLIPAIGVYTIVLGTLSIGSSLFERRGYVAHWCARTWSRLILLTTGVRVDVAGLDRLVPGRTYVFVANHQSIYDIPILFWALPYQLRIIAKESLGRVPFLGWHLRRTGHMLVDRRRPDSTAIFSWASRLTSQGLSLIVFPEGTRSRDGRVGRFKGGSFYLALEAGLPIVPLSVVGSRHVMLKGRLATYPGRVRLVVHEPIATTGVAGRDAKAFGEHVRQIIRPDAESDVEPSVSDMPVERTLSGSPGREAPHRAGPGWRCARWGPRRIRLAPQASETRMQFTVAPDIADIVRPGVLWLIDATVVEREPRLDAPLAVAEAAVRANPPEEIAAVRTMYKRVGIDPTKRRPSSEALLRRVRKGDPLPRINSMVDICNWCSLEFQLPYGLYDTARIEGDVMLRLGREGESYPGIRKDGVHVGGRITLADSLGPFGNPTSDSARTMVTTSTTTALVVVFAPHDVDARGLGRVIDVTSSRMSEFAGCRETGRYLG